MVRSFANYFNPQLKEMRIFKILCLSIGIFTSLIGIAQVDSVFHMTTPCEGDTITQTFGRAYITPTLGGNLTYSWTGPNSYTSTSQDVTDIVDEGLYSVTVDNGTTTETFKVSVGYNTRWAHWLGVAEFWNTYGTQVDVKNISTNAWYRASVSENILEGGVDGWVETMPSNSNTHRMFGLSNYPNSGNTNSDIDYGIYLKNNGDIRRVVSGSETSIGSYVAGDMIKVSREGQYIKFYKNGVELSSSSVDAGTTFENQELVADVCIYTSNALIENLGCSFKGPNPGVLTVTNIANGENGDGNILADPCDITAQTYEWDRYSTDTDSTIGDLIPGSYNVTIDDGNNWIQKQYSSCGYDLDWSDSDNVSITNHVIEKTLAGSAWNAGGESNLLLTASTDGWIEWEVTQTDKQKAIGFTDSPSSTFNYTAIDYGFIFYADGTSKLIRAGIIVGGYETYKVGDVFRIERSGSNVKYDINTWNRHTYTISAGTAYNIQASIYDNGGKFENLRTSFETGFSGTYTTTDIFAAGGTGSIDLSVTGNMGTVSYLWSTGATTQDVSSLEIGEYTVSISDTMHDTIVLVIPIYEKDSVAWYDSTGCTITGANEQILTSTSSGAWTTSQGLAFNYLEPAEDGEFIYTEKQATHHKTIGFVDESVGHPLNSQDDWLYAIHLTNTKAEYRESSVTAKTLIEETAATDDVYKVSRVGTQLSYFKNGLLLRRITVAPTTRWAFHAAFDNNYTSTYVKDVDVSFTKWPSLRDRSYAHLKEHLDGTFYRSLKEVLYVYFDEKYTNGELSYSIKDQTNSEVVSDATLTVTKGFGQNWFEIDLESFGLTDDAFYVLEVSNEKGRVQKLRFKLGSI